MEQATDFDENLPALADRAYALALDCCGPCANYHIYWAARRAAGPRSRAAAQ